MANDTIVALASGSLPAGIGILRVSGAGCRDILDKVLISPLLPSQLRLRRIIDPLDGETIDIGLVIFNPGPNSFTGEDVIEFHLHGSVAVFRKLLDIILGFSGVRVAKAGEFSLRAFENSKLDLSEIEGLGDLLLAETENQRILALSRFEGGLSGDIDRWRSLLLSVSSEIEAHLDFSDEEDISVLNFDFLLKKFISLKVGIDQKLSDYEVGRIVREGFRILVAGFPNVGKSSIINRLTKSDRVIVTSEAGTTRDIVEVRFELAGQLFILVDSAGIREADCLAEKEGIRRTFEALEMCDLVLWVSSPDILGSDVLESFENTFVHVSNKSDLGVNSEADIFCNALSGDISSIENYLLKLVSDMTVSSGSNIISRLRDKTCLMEVSSSLSRLIDLLKEDCSSNLSLELIAEEVRFVIFSFERLLGKIDSEQVLGKIFSGFCIGK